MNMMVSERRAYLLLIAASVLLWLTGWGIPLMEVDAAQYANMSREMWINARFLQVFDLGKDYLDKPPMLFWLSGLSMKIFGTTDAAYRLPSFLFAVSAVYSIYRFALLYYTERIAWLAALVLASCQAMFLVNHDVRTDTMLMGWVTLSIWQWAAWYRHRRWRYLVIGSIAIAGGLLTKGPIALMVPVFSFVPHFLLSRSLKELVRWQYLVAIFIIAVLLLPMCIGLYKQFDLHPEKVMYGKQGNSGLRFFFWTQSFGRITGESTWHENDSFFFLFQNLLWGFLPWTIPFIIGLFATVINLVKKRFFIAGKQEWISSAGFIITYCALGMSRAQLPHYIYVVLPFAALITAKWLHELLYTDCYRRWLQPLLFTHVVIFSLLVLIVFALLILPFPPVNKWLVGLAIVLLLVMLIAITRKRIQLPSYILLSVCSILFINFFINTGFYPKLLQYQLGVSAARVVHEKALPKDNIYTFQLEEERSLDFNANYSFKQTTEPNSLRKGNYLIASQKEMAAIDTSQFITVYRGEGFHVSQLSFTFLNPATRSSVTTPYYIFKRR